MSSPTMEYLSLTAESLSAQDAHRALLLDLEARKRAATMDVPTLPGHVRDALRQRGEPVRLFGEDLAAIRNRLKMVMAREEVQREEELGGMGRVDEHMLMMVGHERQQLPVTETTYTHASPDLIFARKVIGDFSLGMASRRLERERRRRRGMVRWTRGKKRAALFNREEEEEDDCHSSESYRALGEDSLLVQQLDDTCEKVYKTISKQALEGSQYGDVRPLSAVCTSSVSFESDLYEIPTIIATGSWTGGIKIWNGEVLPEQNLSPLDLLGVKSVLHEDRIMGIAMRPYLTSLSSPNGMATILASASIDLTAKLCKIQLNTEASYDAMDKNEMREKQQYPYSIQECAHLKGHAARLCSIAFHPTGKYVATTSFDHTWRLWDVETSSMEEGKELLLQDGHAREVYGVGFHPDGSLVATTDFGGVVQCWDLRTGKSICHFLGHAKRVICSEFCLNGFQLATAGDDGTIKIWDLRHRRPSASISAHTNLISQLKFSHSTSSQNGEFLASCSFDGTGKIWSTRDWKLLNTLHGHEGKVMGIDVLDGPCCSVVTCGYDKTLKLWK